MKTIFHLEARNKVIFFVPPSVIEKSDILVATPLLRGQNESIVHRFQEATQVSGTRSFYFFKVWNTNSLNALRKLNGWVLASIMSFVSCLGLSIQKFQPWRSWESIFSLRRKTLCASLERVNFYESADLKTIGKGKSICEAFPICNWWKERERLCLVHRNLKGSLSDFLLKN